MKSCILASLAFLSAVETTSASTIKYDGPWKWNDIDVKTTTDIGDGGYPSVIKATGTIAIRGYAGSETHIEIPEKITWTAEEWGDNILAQGDHILLTKVIYDLDVVAIAGRTLYENGNATFVDVESVSIGKNILEIGEAAFQHSKNLKSVILPNTITAIPRGCFYGCESLETISLPNTISSIGEYAFYRTALKQISLNNVFIGYRAFGECYALEYVSLSHTKTINGTIEGTVWNPSSSPYPSGVSNPRADEFYRCMNLQTLIVGPGIFEIGDSAFDAWAYDGTYIDGRKTKWLQKLELSEGVTNIGQYAFRRQPIVHLAIPKSCELIGDFAFEGNTNLESLVLGNGLKDIGDRAFYGCGSAPSASKMSLVIPPSVQTIGYRAFAQMDNVTNLVIQGISKACQSQFEYTTNIVSLSFGAGVREIEDSFCSASSYFRLRNLKKLRFESDDLLRIGSYAFSGCAELEELVLPRKIEELGDAAFRYLKRLKDVHVVDSSLTLPKSLVSCGKQVFYECESITNRVVLEEGFSALSDEMFSHCKSIPSVVLPNSLKTIGKQAFYYCTSLKNTRIPFGVEVIGDDAFSSCSSMDEIVLEDGLTMLGNYMFSYSSVQGITIPKTVKTMGSNTFKGCKKLRNVILEDGVSLVADSMFSSCSSLQDVAIPSSVKLLGAWSFQNCTGLTSVNLSEGLCKIGESAFQGCVGLRAMSFPESLNSIGNTAFSGCTSLSTVSFPSGIGEVGVGAFSGCSVKSMLFNNGNGEFLDQFSKESLRTLFLGKSASGITGGLLSDCSALETVMTASTNPNYFTDDGVLYDKAKTTLIKYPCALANTTYTIPSSVRAIDESAFAYASSLNRLNFAGAIDSIGNAAFDWCLGLQTITFCGPVGTIGDDAFMVCPTLEALYFKGDSPSWGENQFWYATPTVYAEKDTAGWGAAATRVGFVVSYIGGGETTVPNAWIDKYPSFLAAAGGDYQAAANSVGANGVTLRESYVAGLDPTDEASKFTAILTIENGEPKISWSPDLSEDAVPRTYTIYGKPSFDADEQWQVVTDGNKSKMKFFKVTVDLE